MTHVLGAVVTFFACGALGWAVGWVFGFRAAARCVDLDAAEQR